MFERLLFATSLAVLGAFGAAGLTQAAKGPDAGDVATGTILVVLGVMAVLTIVYAIKVALGAARALPPEEPAAGEHH